MITSELVRRVTDGHPLVVVLGDVVLDGWFRGDTVRMTREAPVPVVEVAERRFAAGGAANTALNLAALGATVRLVGVVGTDDASEQLLALLSSGGVDVSWMVRHPSVVTTAKTRIVSGDQVIVRVDDVPREAYAREVLDAVVEAAAGAGAALGQSAGPGATAAPEHSARPGAAAAAAAAPAAAPVVAPVAAEIVCDYGLGAVGPSVRAALTARASRPPLSVVDAHDIAAWHDFHPDLITPNAAETAALLGSPLRPDTDRAGLVERFAADILARSGAAAAVVTLDRDGTLLVTAEGVSHRTQAQPATERRASGAGDTFVAALTLARVAGLPLDVSAGFGQAAADIVVRHDGTTVCSLRELSQSVDEAPEVVVPDALLLSIAEAKNAGRRVVFTNGCFDVLHRGHTTYLRQARALGDLLIVAVNSDASARRLKGPDRPINSETDRAAVLASLGFVDYVTIFDEDTPIALIERLRPDIYAKGGDYSAEMLEETAAVHAAGGVVRILDYVADHSTTLTVRRIRASG